MMVALGSTIVWHLRVVTQSIRSLLAYARFAPQSKNWHFVLKHNCFGVRKTQKSEKFFYQKLGHLHINQRQPQCLEITKKVSIFTPKFAQIATVESIIDFLAQKFKSIEYEILWNETLFVFSNTVQPPLFAKKKTSKGIRLWSGFLCRFILP